MSPLFYYFLLVRQPMTLAKVGFSRGAEKFHACKAGGADSQEQKERQSERRSRRKNKGGAKPVAIVSTKETYSSREQNETLKLELCAVDSSMKFLCTCCYKKDFSIAAGGTAETRAGRGAGIFFETPATPDPASHGLAILWKLHKCAARQ